MHSKIECFIFDLIYDVTLRLNRLFNVTEVCSLLFSQCSLALLVFWPVCFFFFFIKKTSFLSSSAMLCYCPCNIFLFLVFPFFLWFYDHSCVHIFSYFRWYIIWQNMCKLPHFYLAIFSFLLFDVIFFYFYVAFFMSQKAFRFSFFSIHSHVNKLDLNN